MYSEILGTMTGISGLISIIILWNKDNKLDFNEHQELIEDFCIDYYDTPIEL